MGFLQIWSPTLDIDLHKALEIDEGFLLKATPYGMAVILINMSILMCTSLIFGKTAIVIPV